MLRDVPPGPHCAACGRCCLGMPGQFFPSDLGSSPAEREERVRALLASGKAVVDCWSIRRAPIYLLRPPRVGEAGPFADGEGGVCSWLGPSGCVATRADRPEVCRAVIPGPNGSPGCRGHSIETICEAWLEYSDWVRAIAADVEVQGKVKQ